MTYCERKDIPAWEPSFWERGNVRYACLSYSLWIKLIWKTQRAYRRKLRAARKETRS